MNRTQLGWYTFCLVALVCDAATALPFEALQKGLRILTAGHSFHVWMPGLLIRLTKNAGIIGNTQVGRPFIGGWQVIQHWDTNNEEQMIKHRLIAKQSELFTALIGHPRDHIKDLSTYCHFAVIDGRSPIVLAMPADIFKFCEAENLNALLQQLALTAFTAHLLNGVTK